MIPTEEQLHRIASAYVDSKFKYVPDYYINPKAALEHRERDINSTVEELMDPGLSDSYKALVAVYSAGFMDGREDDKLRGRDGSICTAAAPSRIGNTCRCMICGRCGQHTGNANQGHFWAVCKVTETTRDFHHCCPDDCELESGTKYVGPIGRFP
jgi:hypothetical protein